MCPSVAPWWLLGALPLCVATFFFLLPLRQNSIRPRTNGPRPPTDALHPRTYGCFVQLPATCIMFSHCLEKVSPAVGGKHMFKDLPTPFCINKKLVGPPTGIKQNNVCRICSLLPLRCSFGSLFVRSMPPSKTACGSTFVHVSPPRPRQQKQLYASHLQFCEFRMLSAIFDVSLMLYTHFSC